MRPLTPYIPFKDVNVEDFVLMRLHDSDLVPMWMGRAQGDIVKDEERFLKNVWRFNGGFQWIKNLIWMNNFYMRIVGMASGEM